MHLYPDEYLTYGGNTASITQKLDNTREYRIADHLGNNRVFVDNSGIVLSTADYEPFGKPLSGSTEDRLSWIDKERDAENGYGNFGVRAYDYDMGRFTSIDPMWEEYLAWSPYQYGLNVPLRVLDPTGKWIDFSESSDPEQAERDFLEALEYLEGTLGGIILRQIYEDKKKGIKLWVAADGQTIEPEYMPGPNVLRWDPSLAFQYEDEDGKTQGISPAVILGHEGAHAWEDLYGNKEFKDVVVQDDKSFGSKEEAWSILDIEFNTAKALGEVTKPRVDHSSGSYVTVPNVDDNGIAKNKTK